MFCGRCRAIVSDFDENCGSETNILTSRDDKVWLLDEFHGVPLGVASDGLVEPLAGDCRAIWVAGQHDREFKERCCSPVKHLNIY